MKTLLLSIKMECHFSASVTHLCMNRWRNPNDDFRKAFDPAHSKLQQGILKSPSPLLAFPAMRKAANCLSKRKKSVVEKSLYKLSWLFLVAIVVCSLWYEVGIVQ